MSSLSFRFSIFSIGLSSNFVYKAAFMWSKKFSDSTGEPLNEARLTFLPTFSILYSFLGVESLPCLHKVPHDPCKCPHD